MKTLPEVEAAKELMNEAMKWSVMKWLRQKKRVRHAADQANASLDRLSDELKRRWPENVRLVYQELASAAAGPKSNAGVRQKLSPARDPGTTALAQKLKNADDRAYAARMAAEQTFDEAEKQLSTSLAREGCVKAIQSWELHSSAIRESEKAVK